MSLLSIYDESGLSPQLSSLLENFKDDVSAYSKSKAEAQRRRMFIIGKIAQFKKQHAQRSADHRLLNEAMKAEGWSDTVIADNVTAYRAYLEFSENINSEFQRVAEVASVSQLKELGRADADSKIGYDTAMFLKRHGSLPPVKALRGYKGGFFNESFKPTNSGKSSASLLPAVSQPAQPAPSVPQEPPENERQIINVTPTAVDIELPSSVVSDNNAADNGIEMDPQQQAVIALDHGLQALDVDSIYGNDVHLDLIAKHGHKLELLIDLINSRKPRFRR